MDWGKGILLSIIAFVGIIMTMVVISVRMDGIELVRDNYYEAEIKYQEQIDRESSTLLLDRDVLAFDSQSKAVILDLPKGAKGNLNLYRPSDVKLDQSVPVEIIESGKKQISIASLKPGYWRVQLTWTENGTEFYQEKKITL
ncbi:MAG: FixH family protein [Cyclobacteriaceae bacterium]|uniref:FixH family protein n=1 Tax=Algoriphagus marincola TaxID=264027 RepID=A0ABS7N410_9BACT|nr:FixH family protein [Algoriphagus marincola]MBY5951024.1 FixH family protein [Algoriphagus marincola]MCR9083348.1 FixH family protein [Cyclobacteriaceae bacterium]